MPPPDAWPGATQFGADWAVGFPGHQEEHGIGVAVRVQVPRFNERVDEGCGETPAPREILAYAVQHAYVGNGQSQRAGALRSRGLPAGSECGRWADGGRADREVPLEPLDRRDAIDGGEVHHQVDGPAAGVAAVPVRELGAGDRQRPLFGVPFGLVLPVALGPAEQQHVLQRHDSRRGGTSAEVVEVHSASLSPPGSSLVRRLRQCFMLTGRVVSVSRSSKAEVRWSFFRNVPHSR